jgi:hypothetical protein
MPNGKAYHLYMDRKRSIQDTGDPHKNGKKAEVRTAAKLRGFGFSVKQMPQRSPFDLLVQGKRIEVKHALPTSAGRWHVNLHRRNVLNESEVDAYVFLLDGIPGNNSAPIYLVAPAPLGKKTMDFSFMTLVRTYRNWVDSWTTIGEPDQKTALWCDYLVRG